MLEFFVDRRRCLGSILALCLGLAVCAGSGACSGADSGAVAKGMNMVLITVDTTRADAFSCYGGDSRNTPHIDALAAKGTRFANAFSETNVTKPSHLSIMTGLRAIEHRVFSNHVLNPPNLVPLGLRFKRKGYATAGFAAAVQLGSGTRWRGFDHFGDPDGTEATADEITSGAMRWLGKQPTEPFFLWVHYFDPHILYSPPKDHAKRYYKGNPRRGKQPLLSKLPFIADWDLPPMDAWIKGIRDPAYPEAMYSAEVQFMDREIGRLLRHLNKVGVGERTAIVLVGDHGEAFGEHGVYYDHVGLFEHSLRVPLIVHVPGLPGGRVVEAPVSQIDIVPTVCELFDLKPAGSGISLAPALEGRGERELEARDVMIFEAAHNKQIAVRRGPWKLIWNISSIPARGSGEHMLFNLDEDPTESSNLFEEHPELVAELRPLIEPWIAIGAIAKGRMPEMSAEVQDMIEALGYVDVSDADENEDAGEDEGTDAPK